MVLNIHLKIVVFSDINECEEDPNICGMGTGSVCQNREGTFECFCYSGYGYGRSGQCEGRYLNNFSHNPHGQVSKKRKPVGVNKVK